MRSAIYKHLIKNYVDSKSWSVCPTAQREPLTSLRFPWNQYLRLQLSGFKVTHITLEVLKFVLPTTHDFVCGTRKSAYTPPGAVALLLNKNQSTWVH